MKLDVSQNPALYRLNCGSNRLTELDMSQNPALSELLCSNNQLTVLDLSYNQALRVINCRNNQLVSLDISQTNFSGFQGTGEWSGFSGNVHAVTATNGKFDLTTLPGFDISKASDWQGGTVSGNILTVPESCTVTYTYDCGKDLSETFTLDVTVLAPARVPGDVTGDGKVNLSDVVRLLKYVSKWDVTINEANSDVTGDGKINLSDVVRLLKYVSNWDVSLV